MEDSQTSKDMSNKSENGVGIRNIINSRYRVFDRSGKLPFSIVFGLVRHSQEDTDPRSIVVQTANSVLDVPYALSHGLLQLRVFNEETKEDVQVDTGHLSQQSGNQGESSVTLPSPVGRKGNWRHSMVTYHYPVDPSSELASLFEPAKKYTIRIVKGSDFGGQYEYANTTKASEKQTELSTADAKPKLVNSKAEGRATFTVAPSLPWPPKVCTQMRWDGKLLEVTLANLGSEAVTVQTRGRQYYCVPLGPMEEEEGHVIDDGRPRLIDGESPSPEWSLQVVDLATKAVVRDTRNLGPSRPPAQKDPRPTRKQLVSLKPDEPLVRKVDVSSILSKLPDGLYGLRMESRGMWWCKGSCEDFTFTGDQDRVPPELYQSVIPPVVLECDDIVEVRVENGLVRE